MKKVLALMLAVCMAFTGVLTAGAFELARHEETQIAYIEGTASGRYVTIIIENSVGEVKHINQYEVVDGKYSAKFPIEGSGEYKYSVKEGANDVSKNSLATVTTYPVEIDVVIEAQENGGKYITEESMVNVVAKLKNKYSDGNVFKLIIAFYDENNKLLGVKISSDYKAEFAELTAKEVFEYGKIPADTARIKAFAWEDEATLVPVAEADNAEVNDAIFGNDHEKVVVTFLGDSISHSGVQQRYLESYYRTKYPDREVVFVNKGINGDTAARIIERFDWDVMNDEYGLSPAPQEAAMMIGMNDIQRSYYGENSTATENSRQAEINRCLANIEKVILLCKENNVTLTLVTPSLYDDDKAFTSGDSNNAVGANDALGKVGEGVKALAEEYNLPLIDLHTATNYWTNEIRKENPGVQVITGTDRIHPDTFGGFVMGYEFVKQQGNSSVIASVNIDANNKTAKAENAKVTNLAFSTDGVSYTYKADSLPVAYNSSYKTAERYSIPVTEDINNEIIKVEGLEEGTYYTIEMNGTPLTNTYTGADLAAGVNIAIDTNNPGQKTALLVDSKIEEKWLKERALRQIPSIEATIVRLKDVCKTGIERREDVEAYLADPANVEAFVTSSYIANSGAAGTYRGWIAEYNSLKANQANEWAAIEALDAEANALAVTQEISVVIKKQ